MFNRFYELMIKSPCLSAEGGEIVIRGDSRKPSLNVSFTTHELMDSVYSQGTVTIYGMTDEHRKQLMMIPRFDLMKNFETETMLTLSVGWNEGEMETILNGYVFNCTPSGPPDRALTFDIRYGNIDRVNRDAVKAAGVLANDPPTIAAWEEMERTGTYDYITDAGASLSAFNVNTTASKSEENTLHGIPLRYPVTASEMVRKMLDMGMPVTFSRTEGASSGAALVSQQDVSVGNQPKITVTKTGAAEPYPIVSEATGMIGIPTVTEMGVDVDVTLNQSFRVGSHVSVKSVQYPNVNFDEYMIMRRECRGTFYGDEWAQRLVLWRPEE